MSNIELKNYIGSKVNYKGFILTVTEVSIEGVRLMAPNGNTAIVKVEKFKEILNRHKLIV